MNSEFVPRLQFVSGIISLLNSILLLFVGGAFLFFPLWVLSVLLDYSSSSQYFDRLLQNDNPIDESVITLSMMVGCVLLGQGISCFLLLYPILLEGVSSINCHNYSRLAVWNVRTSVTIQIVTGLLWVVVALFDDRGNEVAGNYRRNTFGLLLIGFVILLLGCFGMMLSFFPAVEPSDDTIERERIRGEDQESSNQSNDLVEPLLPRDHEDQNIPDRNSVLSLVEEENSDDELEVGLLRDDTVGSENNPEPTSRIRGTQRLLALAKPEVIYLYIGCITLLIRLPFSLSIPHFVSTTLGALSHAEYDRARREIIWLFILGTIDALLDFWCIFWFQYANHRIVRGVRIDTFLSMLRQDIGFFDSRTSGDLSSRLNSDCGEMAGDLTWFFRFSIESVVRITGITTYMLLRSPKLGGVAVSIVPLVAIINKYYGNWLNENAKLVQDALADANSVAQESLACIRTVVAFASEEFEHNKYKERIDEQYRLNIRQTYISGVYFMLVSTFLINTIVQGTLLLVGSYMIQQGKLTSEILLAFMLYQGGLQNEMMNLFNSYSSLIKSSGAGDKVFEILDRKPPPPGTGSHQVQTRLENTTTISDAPISILFEKVKFSYPSRPEQPILKGIDLRIDAGSTFALVGPSGCGKSTIVNLLQRFYDVSSGRIMINGADIKSFDLKQHRQRIGIVTQDPILFTGTIVSNIMYGMPNATKEEAIEAAKSANAHGFICTFPNGYETEVGERGIALSGGQKQRIAIARSIIRHPSLLLLDEATSALDADSETLVQGSIDNLLKHSKSITTIIVAHRLRTVRNADCIAVIKEGGIIEIGSHEKLMTIENGYYKGMIDKSMGDKIMVD